jgi:hypothetical protein
VGCLQKMPPGNAPDDFKAAYPDFQLEDELFS